MGIFKIENAVAVFGFTSKLTKTTEKSGQPKCYSQHKAGFPSGQRGQTQALLLRFRGFESHSCQYTALTQLVECEAFNLKVKGSTPLCGVGTEKDK